MLDSVLFVERSGELQSVARLNDKVMKPKGNRVLIAREYGAIDPKPGDLSMSRLKWR